MVKKCLLILVLLTVLSACNSHLKQLKAPCTYNNRIGCGPIVPLQQKANVGTS